MLSLREIARLWDEFKCPRLFILDTVPAYITVNNCDLIISNNVIISKNTGLFERKYVAYGLSHDDHCLQVCVVFLSFIEGFGSRANICLALPNFVEAIVKNPLIFCSK